jgi:general secretion pathway protein C
MASRWLAFLVWGFVGFCAVAWLLQLSALPRPTPSHALSVDTAPAPRGDWVRLFGAAPAPEVAATAPVRADSRFKLVGVVASRHDAASARGLALIAVDGKPARAFRVGAAVDGETVLQSVRARGAELGPRGAAPQVKLELAPLAPAATGTLPPAGGAQPGGVPGAAPAVPGAAEAAQPQPEQAEPVPPPPGVPPSILPARPTSSPLGQPPTS